MTPIEIEHFFAGLHSKMGHRQIVPYLEQIPEWWTLRNKRGETPLMRSLFTRGMDPNIFSSLLENEEVANTLDTVDAGGKNIWWHLMYFRSYRDDTHQWLPLFRGKVPLTPSISTGRGLFIDHILPRKTRQWSGFFPRGQFAQGVYALYGNSFRTWWDCSEQEAQAASNWLLGVQKPWKDNMLSMSANMRACRSVDPSGMQDLPGTLQGALMLLEALRSPSQDKWDALIENNQVSMNKHARARTDTLIQRLTPSNRQAGQAFLAAHDRQQLDQASRKVALATRARRL